MNTIEKLRSVGQDYDFHDNALIYEAADTIESLQKRYELECKLRDEKIDECLRLDLLLRECEEKLDRGEKMTGQIEQYLEKEIAELNEQLAAETKNKEEFKRDWLECCDKLLASKAREKVLNGALRYIRFCLPSKPANGWHREFDVIDSALAQPTDDTALKAALKEEREQCAAALEAQHTWITNVSAANIIRALGDSE